jgi:hypothetical protein
MSYFGVSYFFGGVEISSGYSLPSIFCTLCFVCIGDLSSFDLLDFLFLCIELGRLSGLLSLMVIDGRFSSPYIDFTGLPLPMLMQPRAFLYAVFISLSISP